jgi:CelD/BcsL family acetyltransferase involved in cellulose biosynthesis
MIKVEVISRTPDIAHYRDEWESLYRASSAEPSTSFEWTQALTHSHMSASDGFALVRLTRGRELVGLVPLTTRRVSMLGYPVTVLSPLSEHYNTHSDVLVRELNADAVSAVVSAVYSIDLRWDLFRMSNLLEGHPLLLHGPSLLARRGSSPQLRASHASYFLELPKRFDAYLGQRSAKFRNHLKRVEKRIADKGRVRVRDMSQPAGVASGFEMLLQIEQLSWKHAHGTAISAVPRQAVFYRRLCEGAAASGRLHLQFLTIADAPVAYNLGYLHNGCYYYLKTSYDEQYKADGVSTYLRARLVESLIERGAVLMDFPAEPYEWERQWTETVRWHQALTAYRSTAAGRVLSWIDLARRRPIDRDHIAHVDPRGLHRVEPARQQKESSWR